MTLNKCTVKKIWETFSFWQHFTWWKLLVNTTYNTIWLLTTCNCNSHITRYYWQFFTRLFKIKFLTNRNDDTIHTRLFLELHVHVRSSYKHWNHLYERHLQSSVDRILNWYSIDTPSTHWADTPWTIKRHLSRESVDSPLIFYCFIWVGWHSANYQLTVDLVLIESGSKIKFFQQAPTGNRNFFFSRQMKKCGRQKVLVKLCSETKPKLLVAMGLPQKIFVISM